MTPSDELRIPALDRLGVDLRDRVESRRPVPAERSRIVLAVTVTLLVLTTVVVATPQGRAAAEWVARAIGLSDDMKPETLDERLSNALPVGAGASPGGEQYSVYADRDADEGLCLEVVWTEADVRGFGTCQMTGVTADLAVPFISAAVPGTTTVAGIAPAATAEVDVSYQLTPDSPTARAPSQVFSLTEETRAELKLSAEQTYAFFVAFLPEGVGDVAGASTARGVAYDERGNALGESPIRWATTDVDDPLLSMVSCTDGNTVTQRFCEGAR